MPAERLSDTCNARMREIILIGLTAPFEACSMDDREGRTEVLAEAVAALKYLSRMRHGMKRGTVEYAAAIERESDQIETVRDLASRSIGGPAAPIKEPGALPG